MIESWTVPGAGIALTVSDTPSTVIEPSPLIPVWPSWMSRQRNKPPSSTVLRDVATALGLPMSSLIEAAEVRMESRQEAPIPVTSAEGWAIKFGAGRRAGGEAPLDQDALRDSHAALFSTWDVVEPPAREAMTQHQGGAST